MWLGGVILGGDGCSWEIGQRAVTRMGKCLPNAPGTGCQPSVPAGRGALSTQEIGTWARLTHGDDLAPKHLGCERDAAPLDANEQFGQGEEEAEPPRRRSEEGSPQESPAAPGVSPVCKYRACFQGSPCGTFHHRGKESGNGFGADAESLGPMAER